MICAPVSFTSPSFRDESAVGLTGWSWFVVLRLIGEGLCKEEGLQTGLRPRKAQAIDRHRAYQHYSPVSAPPLATNRDLRGLHCLRPYLRHSLSAIRVYPDLW